MKPRKAKKISTPIPQELQAPDEKAGARPKRTTTRLIHETLYQVLEEIETIGNATVSASQIKVATSALYTLMETARKAILCLIGAPSIITQIDVDEFCAARENSLSHTAEKWMGTELVLFTILGERLKRRFKAGWTVEPGRFIMERDNSGVICISDSVELQQIRDEMRARKKVRAAARASKIDTPSPEQLQVWFDLHSEPPQAEALPSGS